MGKGNGNQFDVLMVQSDIPAPIQAAAKIFLHFNNCNYLQTDNLFSIGKSEEKYRKGENPKNSEHQKTQRVVFFFFESFSCLAELQHCLLYPFFSGCATLSVLYCVTLRCP